MVICIYSAYVHICTYRHGIKINHRVTGLLHLQANKKKILVSRNEVTSKIFTQVAANLFFNAFSRYIIFSSLLSLAFICILVFLCLLVCFLKIKIYSDTHSTM